VCTSATFLSAVPAIARERYPGLTVEVSGRMTTVDLAKGDTDIALRMAKPTDVDLLVRKGVAVGWLLVAGEPTRVNAVSRRTKRNFRNTHYFCTTKRCTVSCVLSSICWWS